MGAGIAYVAAAAGMDVGLYDVGDDPLERGVRQLGRDLDGAVARGECPRLTRRVRAPG